MTCRGGWCCFFRSPEPRQPGLWRQGKPYLTCVIIAWLDQFPEVTQMRRQAWLAWLRCSGYLMRGLPPRSRISVTG